MAQTPKQAVILIHGIGEQRPMDALRGFVEAVWTSDSAVHHAHAKAGVYSKPDRHADSFELRRLTTTQNRRGVRTDFYEFYWAPIMEGTSLRHVIGWAWRLLWRDPRTLPKGLRPAWFGLLAIVVLVAAFALQTLLPPAGRGVAVPPWFTGLLGLVAAWFVVPLVNAVIGDAARYLDPAPGNVGRRQAIRSAGVGFLERLHASGEYDRIVVVGHSLGSVIGYDVLTHAWSRLEPSLGADGGNAALDEMEAALAESAFDLADYRRRQRRLARELRLAGHPWCVTDFVTLGSPLAHAQVLLARDARDLRSKQRDRELPTCPPQLESGRFSYPVDRVRRTLHHAAVFAPTRWTNLYFPARGLVAGDPIAGPLGPLFGAGVADVPLAAPGRGGAFAHTRYWRGDGTAVGGHIVALRRALDLLDAQEEA